MSGPQSRPRQTWLPSLGIWANVGDQGVKGGAAGPSVAGGRGLNDEEAGGRAAPSLPRKRKADALTGSQATQGPAHVLEQPPLSSQQQQQPQKITGYALQEQLSGSESSSEEEGREAEVPTCTICLLDVVNLEDKAVLNPCMHAYHDACISEWLRRKLQCPLCKTRVNSVLFDIRSPGRYRERQLPPSPPSDPLSQELDSLIREVTDMRDMMRQSQYGSSLRPGGGSREFRRGRELGSWGENRPRDLRAGHHSSRQQGQQQRGRRSGAAAAGASGQAEPRPYFWRVHQRMQAGGGARVGGLEAARPGASRGEEGGGGDALAWRRMIYDQGLWAEPPAIEDRSRLVLGSGSSRERRLTAWLDRELRALLRTDDITIVKGLVMGIVAMTGVASGGAPQTSTTAPAGLTRPSSSRRGPTTAAGGGGGSGGSRSGAGSEARGSSGLATDPVAALQPFLHGHAAHFWHELRCFATSPFTMPTYHRVTRYSRALLPPLQQQQQQHGLAREQQGLQEPPPPPPPQQQSRGQGLHTEVGPRSEAARQRPSRWDRSAAGTAGAPVGAGPGAGTAGAPVGLGANGRAGPLLATQEEQEQQGRAIHPAEVVYRASEARTAAARHRSRSIGSSSDSETLHGVGPAGGAELRWRDGIAVEGVESAEAHRARAGSGQLSWGGEHEAVLSAGAGVVGGDGWDRRLEPAGAVEGEGQDRRRKREGVVEGEGWDRRERDRQEGRQRKSKRRRREERRLQEERHVAGLDRRGERQEVEDDWREERQDVEEEEKDEYGAEEEGGREGGRWVMWQPGHPV